MIAEYVAVAGAPTGETPWPLVLEIANRTGQFEARRHLTMHDAVRSAIGASFGGDAIDVERMRDKLHAEAYPGSKLNPDAFAPNVFAEGDDG